MTVKYIYIFSKFNHIYSEKFSTIVIACFHMKEKTLIALCEKMLRCTCYLAVGCL